MTSSEVACAALRLSVCALSKISPYGLRPYSLTTFAGFQSSVPGAAACHEASVKIVRSVPSANFTSSTPMKPAALPLFVASARSSFFPARSFFVTFACVGLCQSGFTNTDSPLRKTSAPLSQVTRSVASFTAVLPRSNSFFKRAELFDSGESLHSHFHSGDPDVETAGAASAGFFASSFALPLPFGFASAFSNGLAFAI